MGTLNDYRRVVGEEEVDAICSKAEKLSQKHILAINSPYQGGGVAEILNSLVVLFGRVGIDFGWRILHGTPDFFTVTKKFHNALQGKRINGNYISKTLRNVIKSDSSQNNQPRDLYYNNNSLSENL